jgi:tetratricopeptide (TPR) repeat protein
VPVGFWARLSFTAVVSAGLGAALWAVLNAIGAGAGIAIGAAGGLATIVVTLGALWVSRARGGTDPASREPALVPQPFSGQAIASVHGPVFGPRADLSRATLTFNSPPASDQLGQGTTRAVGLSRQRLPQAEEADSWLSTVPRDGEQIVVGEVPREPAGYRKRKDLFAQLDRATAERDGPVIQSIIGMLGVGKTHLAAEYARERLADGWRLVAWINVVDETANLSGLAQVASELGLRTDQSDAGAAGLAVRHWLETGGDRCLLVFNGLENVKVLEPFLPAGGHARILITTNQRSAARLGTTVSVDVFSESEALAFLGERTGSADTPDACAVAAELGYLPLALAAAAAVIADQHLEYGVYLKRLRTLPVEKLLPRVQADLYPRSVAAAVLMSLDGIRSDDETGKVSIAVLEMMSVLSSGSVPRALLYATVKSGALARITPSNNLSDVAVDEALGRLTGSSLTTFSVDDGHIGAHPLVLRVVKEKMTQERRLRIACGAVGSALLFYAESVRQAWNQPAVRDLVEQLSAAYEHMKSLSGELESSFISCRLKMRLERARFLDDLGGSPAEAIEAGASLLTDAGREFGADDPFTLTCRHNLAIAYQQAGKYAEAISLYEKNLTDRQQILGGDDPATLTSRNSLATAYHDACRYDEAITLYEMNLRDRERVLGACHPDTLASRNNLATAYQDTGRIEYAIPLYETNCVAGTPGSDADLADFQAQLNEAALVQQDKRWVRQVILLHERTRADGSRTIGPGHPDSLGYRNNLATAYLEVGRMREAADLLEQTWEDKKERLGSNHRSTLTSQSNLAVACLGTGPTWRAVKLLRDALTDCERTLGSTHGTTEIVRGNLAVAQMAMATTPR